MIDLVQFMDQINRIKLFIDVSLQRIELNSRKRYPHKPAAPESTMISPHPASHL